VSFFNTKFFETDTDTFYESKIFRNRYRYFFWYQNFSKPIPILFSIPIFFETDTDTFFDTKFFRNQYRYFFRYQNFSKPIPIPSKQLEKFRNRNVTLCCLDASFHLPGAGLIRVASHLDFLSNFNGAFLRIFIWQQTNTKYPKLCSGSGRPNYCTQSFFVSRNL